MFRLENPLPTCDSNLVPIVCSRSEPLTPRRAADSSGHLGLFYDACCDQVLSQSSMHCTKQSGQSRSPPTCYIKPYNSKEFCNLLKWYNIHHELRVSIALQLVREVGVCNMINYSRPINQYTRIIFYTYLSHTDYISDEEFRSLSQNKLPMPNTDATHVIVLVNWGVCALAIVELPSDPQNLIQIDNALEKLCTLLKSDSIHLSNEHERLLRKLNHIEVFSSIPTLAAIKSIVDFPREIVRVKNEMKLFKPYNYNLCDIRTFYNLSNNMNNKFIELHPQQIVNIENYFDFLSSHMKRFRAVTNQSYPRLQQYLNGQLSKIKSECSRLEDMYLRKIQSLGNLVINIRRGRIDHKIMDEALNKDKNKTIFQYIDDFGSALETVQEKETFIDHLLQKRVDYRNAREFNICDDDEQKTIKSKLLEDIKYDYFICFDDTLRQKERSKWDNLNAHLTHELMQPSMQRTIFVDFTYCKCKSLELTIKRETEKSTVNTVALPVKAETPSLSKPATVPSSRITSPPSRITSDETINILLLGETGVGKSTFINAFANYLAFDTLEQAQNNPLVLMPIWFLMTTGDNFQEKHVTFGMQDDLSNEDYSQPGQSVTQHCKSYVFTLKESDNKRRKLRIIDTPGIGDVRGIDQDDINMQHILLYISNLSHLSGICILMKPNNSRLNFFFRSCFVQLFNLLGESIRDRIIFCFTNSRSTFYTPGSTGPLVRELLKSLPVVDIPFNKTNTFCFESEAFRYLVAKQNKIEFNALEEADYHDSWKKSSNESKRFLQYICTKTIPSLNPGEGRSIKNAELQIGILVRPMLETLRNILRNLILWEKGSQTTSIELYPSRIEDTAGICLTCPRQFLKVADFWIVSNSLHVFRNRCRTCLCNSSDHYSVDYQLQYKLNDCLEANSNDKMNKMLNGLCKMGAQFANFLTSITNTPEHDLFLAGIKRMIKEESDVCENKSSCDLNSQLLQQLRKLKKHFEDMKKVLPIEKGRIGLETTWQNIDTVNSNSLIRSQVTAAKLWHKFMIKHYEYEVSDRREDRYY